MLNLNEVKCILECNLAMNDDYIGYIDRCHNVLNEPSLFINVANKRLMLESIRKIKHLLLKVIQNMVDWSKNSKNNMVERIIDEVMYMVYEFRDVQNVFNLKFDGDAYVNYKTEDFRRHMRDVLDNEQNIDDIKVALENTLIKTNIDFELMQLEYVERLHEWLKIVTASAEDNIGQIFKDIYNPNEIENAKNTRTINY